MGKLLFHFVLTVKKTLVYRIPIFRLYVDRLNILLFHLGDSQITLALAIMKMYTDLAYC